jgi:hypothetical protein
MAWLNSHVYKLILGEEAYRALKESNPAPAFGKNHGSKFRSPELREQLRVALRVVAAIADASDGPTHFMDNLKNHFGRQPQLRMRYGARKRLG